MKFFSTLLLLFATSLCAFADEGMWVLPLLNKMGISKAQELGCKLSAEDIYSVNSSSLKDAVIIFGGGCTGEIVSANGLIFTNHHCGYGAIQQLSSVAHNYLRDGFWAQNYDEELYADGLKVKFLREMNDVTEEVTKGASLTVDSLRKDSIDANIRRIEKLYKSKYDSLGYNKEFLSVQVSEFLDGNQYFVMVYEVYPDVRLVGTPPEAIGKFGHDTDNWMWPRHTGDFSIFRVYATADGKPAKFSAENKPLACKTYLPISLKGVQPGDFAMTVGFPGSTERYITSWGLNNLMNASNMSRIEPRDVKQKIWLEDMNASEAVKIKYASKYARSSNYWKNAIGQNRGVKRLNVMAQKEAVETQFAEFAAKPENANLYGQVLSNLKTAYSNSLELSKNYNYAYECLFGGCELIRFSAAIKRFVNFSDSKSKFEEEKATLISSYRDFLKDYNQPTDRKTTAALMALYAKLTPAEFHPSVFKTIQKKYKGNFAAFTDKIFDSSILTDSVKFIKAVQSGKIKSLTSDPVYNAYWSFRTTLLDLSNKVSEISKPIYINKFLFLKGLMEMQPERLFYSDANFTMRASFGKVGGYKAADAVTYNHFTTLAGVMEKEDPANWEFNVPSKLKELYKSGDYGRYADADGTLHTCFLTNNDITGGNSGSPVINAEGQLIGLAFDGNWEAMSGDIAFEPKLQKTICVDIRYVLFIIEKLGGASNIISELNIAK